MTYQFNQQSGAADSYVRCPQIVIDNRLGGTPAITFAQETIITAPSGQVTHVPMQPIPLVFDPTKVIDIIDPTTGQPTGATATMTDVYNLIYSAYMLAANPPAAPAPTV